MNYLKEDFKNKPRFIHKPELIFEYERDGFKYYSLADDLIYWTGKKQIVIKKVDKSGVFITNLSSIPKVLHWIIKPDNKKLIYPSILHDGLYSKHSIIKRIVGDWLYLGALKVEGFNALGRWVVFLSVRLFGKDYYRSN
jgi:hypothetical protein